MARTVLPFVGAAIGFWLGGPTGAQIGFALGGVVGGAVDPAVNRGPKIGETGAQTSAEGAFRAIVYGTASVTGNVIATGPMIETTNVETQGKGGPVNETSVAYRSFAIRICEGPIAGVLRVWQDDKLVYDIRPGSVIPQASTKWKSNKVFYLGDEAQLPDVFLQLNVSGVGETPAYRGSAYMVVGLEDLTDRRGSIYQYRFEVASAINQASWAGYSWTAVQATTWASLPALAVSDDGLVVATGLGSAGLSWSSSDLATWQTTSIPNGSNKVAYGNGVFVAVDNGSNTNIWVGNGSSWSNVPHSVPIDKEGVAFGNGIFVITGHNIFLGTQKTIVGTGSGGWTENTIADDISGPIRFGNGLFVSLQPNQVSYSANGITWAQAAAPMASSKDIEWVDEFGLWVLIGINSTNGVATSPDLITWTQRTTPNEHYYAGAWAPELGIFAIIGNSGAFITSTNLVTWTAPGSTPGGGGEFTDVIWSPVHGKFVGVAGSTSRIVVSNTTPASAVGLPLILGDIVADIHDRCGIAAAKRNVAELTDLVDGLVLAGDYTGADAITTLRGPYFFDKTEYGKKLWYPKRGKPVVLVLDIDDLVEEPDSSRREQAVEFPKKLHLFYQHAASGYAAVKATSSRSSPDARVVGELSTQVPVVLDENEAAQIAHKMHKVAWAEAEGEVVLSVPESFIGLVPSDNIGLNLRSQVKRLRIDKMEYAAGIITLTMRHDRQSAYTSNVTGVPIPLPMPPPSTIVGSTTLAVLDIGARQDGEDDLHILVAGSGTAAGWYGWTLQRSLDGGANWTTVQSFSNAAVMGSLLDAVPAADEHTTDATNTVRVQLYRDSQTLEDMTAAQFLAEGGAFALEKADGTWEVMQYRDAAEDSAGVFSLTMLHRGRLYSGAAAHVAGAKFVMLAGASHIVMQSAWIGQAISYRAVSLSQSPELATVQTATYVGRSQLEWPVASLTLARAGNVVTGSWAPRHRFGTDDAPVASVNFTGYRIAIVGTSTVTFDQTAATFTYDVSAIGGGVTVSVQALNRITGAGPSVSDSV